MTSPVEDKSQPPTYRMYAVQGPNTFYTDYSTERVAHILESWREEFPDSETKPVKYMICVDFNGDVQNGYCVPMKMEAGEPDTDYFVNLDRIDYYYCVKLERGDDD